MAKRESEATDVDGSPSVTEHRGRRIAVYRVDNPGGGYAYEFELYVDGEYVTNASALERKGRTGPPEGPNWTSQLKQFGKEHIDARKDYGEFGPI